LHCFGCCPYPPVDNTIIPSGGYLHQVLKKAKEKATNKNKLSMQDLDAPSITAEYLIKTLNPQMKSSGFGLLH
jgi:hypothetical protein